MLTGKTFAEVYEKLLKEVLNNGEEVRPRGQLTKELIQETFCIKDPTSNLIYIPGRSFSLVHAILESLIIFTNDDTVKVAGHFNERIAQFSDDGETLHGAYGKRISPFISVVIDKLRKDNDSRQAVLTIHRVNDSAVDTKDPPCTITLQFTIRRRKLNMHVYMRSNDLIWGTPYDVFVFTTIQQVVANTLGIPVGTYYHTATSLHIYENYFEEAKKYLGKCKAITHVNRANYSIWMQCAEAYRQFIHSNTNDNIERVIRLSYSCPELAVLNIEEVYRDKNKKFNSFVDVGTYAGYIYKNLDMSFAKPFTKRWLKAGIAKPEWQET